jgi:hypothetical protein
MLKFIFNNYFLKSDMMRFSHLTLKNTTCDGKSHEHYQHDIQ